MSRIALTGTPGTGKTTVSRLVADDLGIDVVHLNDVIREAELFESRDVERDSLVADLDAVEAWLVQRADGGDGADDDVSNESEPIDRDVLVESHLAHLLDVDRVIVLRCRPDDLKPRLRERGESETSIAENAESEALDVILAEAVERHGAGSVWEIDTTDRSPEEVADDVAAAIGGDIEPRVGTVDFVEYL
ncbi:adenylate kinase family protein [Halobellus captivus]|uniref:adenylate kinase family protein n=1 Tax=Halobellus captivus TaxID=2592614 RepID=UPI0011A5D8F4|nr:adenylate kinase family protein [Halobellus captivus]